VTTRTGLSRDRILDAAGELLASDDASAFSMRRLAERLEVTPMALYKWFANKDELLGALTDRVVATPVDVGAGPADEAHDGPWLERALRFSARIRAHLVEHLPVLQVEGASRRLASSVFRDADEGLRFMLEIGYEDQDAVDAYRVLFWSVLDFCLVVDANGAMPSASAPEVLAQVAGIEGDDLAIRMPTLALLLHRFSPVDPDVFFERSMRAVLTGLLADAPAG